MRWIHGRPHDARMAWDHEEPAMRERPIHPIHCPCRVCLGGRAEPTRGQVLSLLAMIAVGTLLLWWA